MTGMECSKIVHRGGRYSRLEQSLETLCHNCGERIDDLMRLGVLLT